MRPPLLTCQLAPTSRFVCTVVLCKLPQEHKRMVSALTCVKQIDAGLQATLEHLTIAHGEAHVTRYH
jgi:hypothetical protein